MRVRKAAAALGAVLWLAASAHAADDPNAPKIDKPNFSYKTVQTKEGLVFRVPADMPIEIKNGLQVPMPFDEYIYSKLATLEAKLSRLDQRLSGLEQRLDRLSAAAAPAASAAPAETAAPAPAEAPAAASSDATGILKA